MSIQHRGLVLSLTVLLSYQPIMAESELEIGIDWHGSEKARILEDILPITPDIGGGPLLPSNTIILSHIEGPVLNLGYGLKRPSWRLGFRVGLSPRGSLLGEGSDEDYLRLEDSRIGLRAFPGGPRTGDSVYASQRTLTFQDSPFQQRGAQKRFSVEGLYFWGAPYIGLAASYNTTDIEASSPGYSMFYSTAGPILLTGYSPLDFEIKDIERSLGIVLGGEWISGPWAFDLGIRIANVYATSRYFIYTRNRSIIWEAKGWSMELRSEVAIAIEGTTTSLFARASLYRSSAVGNARFSDIGILTPLLSGRVPLIIQDIARVEERSFNLGFGVRSQL